MGTNNAMKLTSHVELQLESSTELPKHFTKITKFVIQNATIDTNPYWLRYVSMITMLKIRKNEVARDNGKLLSPTMIQLQSFFQVVTGPKCIAVTAQVVFNILKNSEVSNF